LNTGDYLKMGLETISRTDVEKVLKEKRILVVDDEPDVLEQIAEILSDAFVDAASSFEEATRLLENNLYDAAVLDIMGVRGYELLEICRQKEIPTIMLTAKALTKDDLLRSLRSGAKLFLPKDEMPHLNKYLAELLEASYKQKRVGKIWMERLEGFLKKLLGTNYKDENKDLWDKLLRE